jgi:hypothetical protein
MERIALAAVLAILAALGSAVMAVLWGVLLYDWYKIWRGRD